MTRSTHPAHAWALSIAAVGCAVGLATVPVASAQLPAGVSMQDVQSAISAPISVPAGETVTVDLGVPVSTSYAGGGWSVSSAGTSVTVTAPTTPGAQASVPVSAAGQSATITLIATENAALPAPAPGPAADGGAPAEPAPGEAGQAPPQGDRAAEEGSEPGATGSAGAGAENKAESAAPTPERMKAEPVDTTGTRYVDLAAVVDGRSISAQLGLGLAADLYRQFQDVDQDSVQLRYLDVNGQVIEGVSREVDMASRSLTLTYPEGQTPDNPFILQVVRDGSAILVVRLVAENYPVARASDPADVPAEFDRPTEVAESSAGPVPAVVVIVGIIALVAIVAVVAALSVRSRRRRRSQ